VRSRAKNRSLSPISHQKKIGAVLSFVVFFALLIMAESWRNRPPESVSEGCVSCHRQVSDPDPSHPISAFKCQACHLGNPYSLSKERAHLGVVRNPGDLRVLNWTCGKTGCHPDVMNRVKNSLMATNRGMLKTIQEKWLKGNGMEHNRPVSESGGSLPDKDHGQSQVVAVGVRDLLTGNSPENFPIEHYRKMCGGCHLWKPRKDRPGEVGRRGGGCSDCHVLDGEERGFLVTEAFEHPRMTTRIPSANCVKCHNRSARIGLSYFGKYESEGYGTPYEGAGFSSRRLSGGRFFLQLTPDIHFAGAGMECIDCHTGTGLMGDGNSYDRMEDQLDITCTACHNPVFSEIPDSESLTHRLLFLNKKVPGIRGGLVGRSRKGTPLYNLQKRDGKIFFYRKLDGQFVEMKIPSPPKSHHALPGHERLSCQACHSSWMPQCYGCHVTYRKSERQRDWISGEESSGRWRESRSYIRFSKPALGLRDHSTVFPISPCQVFVSFFDDLGRYRKDRSFEVFTVSAFDPHTTTLKTRACIECHGDQKVLGIGEGLFYGRDGVKTFRPTYDASRSGLGISCPLDSFISGDGETFQVASGERGRPFNRNEMERILSVRVCIGCHDRYEDRIYEDFSDAKRRFETEEGLPCTR